MNGQTYVKFLIIKIMKKIIYTAAMVSCDADVIDNARAQTKDLEVQKTGLKFNESYTSPLSNASSPMVIDGPVNEIIIITPPKKS